MALVSKSSSRKQVLGCRHRRLLATAFHEGYVGKAIERCEPGVDIGYHRFQQDAVCHAAHAHTVPRQSKRQRQPHGLGANVHKNFSDADIRHDDTMPTAQCRGQFVVGCQSCWGLPRTAIDPSSATRGGKAGNALPGVPGCIVGDAENAEAPKELYLAFVESPVI